MIATKVILRVTETHLNEDRKKNLIIHLVVIVPFSYIDIDKEIIEYLEFNT